MKVPGSHVIRQGDHRAGLALEVEGYEIRDCVHVVTPGGVEQWWVARWPVEGTVTSNVLKHGVGALNIDGCRVSTSDNLNGGAYAGDHRDKSYHSAWQEGSGFRQGIGEFQPPSGRWPPNLVYLHAEGCLRVGDTADPAYVCAPGCPVAALDEMSGVLTTGAMSASVQRGKLGGHGVYGSSDGSGEGQAVEASSGGASRFFPCFESKEELVEWISRLVGLQTGVE